MQRENVYREKIREYYDHLSRSYRRVADYILSNYYEVSFMTAAQLATLVDVDTTTVVRFSQRIGYNGYPELLSDIREQVRSEIYAAYMPRHALADGKAAKFKARVEQERQNLSQMLVHNPPEHMDAVVDMLNKASHIVVMAEGYADSIAQTTVQQLRHRGFSAEAVPADPIQRAGTLTQIEEGTLILGISATNYGRDVARAMAYARSKGCATLGIVGSMESPINRMADRVIYAPAHADHPLPSLVALTAALSSLVSIVGKEDTQTAEEQNEAFNEVYQFLTQPDVEAIEEEADA